MVSQKLHRDGPISLVGMLFIDSSDSHWSTTFYNKRPRRHGGMTNIVGVGFLFQTWTYIEYNKLSQSLEAMNTSLRNPDLSII